jgi:hypothetical protein
VPRTLIALIRCNVSGRPEARCRLIALELAAAPVIGWPIAYLFFLNVLNRSPTHSGGLNDLNELNLFLLLLHFEQGTDIAQPARLAKQRRNIEHYQRGQRFEALNVASFRRDKKIASLVLKVPIMPL